MFQLIYASAATFPFSQDELAALMSRIHAANTDLGVSGIMLYHDGSFLQVLEGEEEVVAALFARIEKDPRHSNIKILFRDTVSEREFGDWSMGFVTPADHKDLPDGFVDYVWELKTRNLGKTRAKKVLKMFQEGLWHQKIECCVIGGAGTSAKKSSSAHPEGA